MTPHQCKRTMCKEEWDTTTTGAISLTIPLVASKDQIQDGNSDLLLSFEELISVGGGPYLNAFGGYQIQSVQIQVEKDPAETCTMVTDPHITSIDSNSNFNLYRVGDYTAFQNPSRHFEVQIRTWPCNGGRVTCICGVAIREKDDLIRIHGCERAYYSVGIGAPDIEVVRPLRQGTSVKQSTDGHEIAVYLPSGSEVIVKAFSDYGGHFNVHMAIPSADKGKGAGGLCGTYDGDATNDFTHRDGTLQSACGSYCTPETFTESWKNDRSTSLFRITPPALNEDYNVTYCQCKNGTTQINCTARGDVAKPVIPCTGCQDKLWLGGDWKQNRRRAADGTVYADVDDVSQTFDPDDYADFVPATLHWPTPSGITEQQAEAKCRQALHGSQLWSHCQGQTAHANNNIDNCKEDVLFGDSFDSLQSLIDSFTSDCQAELSKDPANYVTNAEGENVIKPEMSSDVCSTTCLQNGRCEKGRCLCNPGFTGDTCQLMEGQGPQLLNIRDSEFCDINARPCRKVFINVTNVQMSDKLTCKVQEILPSGEVSTKVSFEDGEFLSGIKMMCSLPDARVKSERSVKKFMISASMDGSLYGNALSLTVYDSVCQSCNDSGCVHLPNTCLIGELCYADGDVNPLNKGNMCTIANSTTQWTNLYPEMTAPSLIGPNSDGAMACSVRTNDTSPTARYRVSWYLNGQPYPRQRELNLPPGVLTAVYNMLDLPRTGLLMCKMSSYYTGETISSPALASNSIDLQAVTRPS